MKNFPFTNADVEANFGLRDLTRGRSSWRKGAVRDLVVENNGHSMKARVRANQARFYDVVVTIQFSEKVSETFPSHVRIKGRCSCAAGVDCAHVAAVCLAALKSPKLSEELSKHYLPDEIQKTPQNNSAKGTLEKLPQKLSKIEDHKLSDNKEKVFYILKVAEDLWSTPPWHLLILTVVSNPLKAGHSTNSNKIAPYQLFQSQAPYVTPEDRYIGKLMQEALHSYAVEFQSPPGDPEVFDHIMRRVLATGRCYFEFISGSPLTLGETKSAQLGWKIETSGAQQPAIIVGDNQSSYTVLPASHPWYIDRNSKQVGPLSFQTPLASVHKYLSGPKLLPRAAASVAAKMAGRNIQNGVLPPRAVQLEKKEAVKPVPCLRLTTYTLETRMAQNLSENERMHNLALFHCTYDGVVADPGSSDTLRRPLDNKLIAMKRDREAEAKFANYLNDTSGLILSNLRPFDVPKDRLSYTFMKGTGDRIQWINFLHHEVPELRSEGWQITVDDDFAEQFSVVEADKGDKAWEGDLKEQEGGAWWFSLDLGIMVAGQRVALLPLLVAALKRLREPTTTAIESLARSGKLYVDLPDGRALALPFDRVKGILTTLVELYDKPLNADGSMNVSLDLAAALSRIDTATKMRWLGGKRLKQLIERLKTFQGLIPIEPPKGLQATLRPYQREGLNWLQFLRDYGLGGILADDMGLGKTIQTLAHIMVEKAEKRLDRPCLIVCPTSLVPNWQDEAAKFAPKLKILSLHGKERAARFGDIEKADIVLTTYPLLSRDCEVLLPTEWHIVVLDEAQMIKNPAAQVTQLACELKARHRLCLTGTPIENHLGEVWSHFTFLMPGMLGTHKDFNKRFRTPIEKLKDSDRQMLLARRLKPFILRRNKSEVAKELPPKTEIIHHVEFDSAQRDLYETLRLTMHEKVQQAVSEKGFNRSRIVILDALMKLRQVCCDPRLANLSGAKKVKHSAKLDSLMEMLPEMIEEGRRILLFSQFTSMLDLIKIELDKIKISYVEIRGDTMDRKAPVTRFQNGEVPLFLISLKAGGTGLNLTAADTVIHYDPWWNPAVENQATDRAHRIGQDKNVFVYKFIAKGTVEDRIIDLQNRKRNLALSIMEDRAEATAAFEIDDLEYLFKDVV